MLMENLSTTQGNNDRSMRKKKSRYIVFLKKNKKYLDFSSQVLAAISLKLWRLQEAPLKRTFALYVSLCE